MKPDEIRSGTRPQDGGRDAASGRFTAGNQAALGHKRPHAAKRMDCLKAMMDALRPEAISAITMKMQKMALEGDPKVMRLVFELAGLGPGSKELERTERMIEEAERQAEYDRSAEQVRVEAAAKVNKSGQGGGTKKKGGAHGHG